MTSDGSCLPVTKGEALSALRPDWRGNALLDEFERTIVGLLFVRRLEGSVNAKVAWEQLGGGAFCAWHVYKDKLDELGGLGFVRQYSLFDSGDVFYSAGVSSNGGGREL